MILLVSTTDKLQLTTDAAVTVDVHASWIDRSGTTFTEGKTNSAISTATTTDIVAAPAASTARNVKTLNIRNKHASSNVTVTVLYDASGTDCELHKQVLKAGDTLEYIEGIGWFTVQSAPIVGMLTLKGLASDQSNATTTATEVTGLSVTTGTGNFSFKYVILCQTSVTTTTPKFAVNHTGTVTSFVYWIYAPTANVASVDGVIDQDMSLTTGGQFCVNAARAKSTTALTAYVSVDTANADALYIIDGLFVCTVDGDLELWHGSETANSTTVKAGSILELRKAS